MGYPPGIADFPKWHYTTRRRPYIYTDFSYIRVFWKGKGHIDSAGRRRKAGKTMTDEARKARNAYKRAWAKANPDRVRAHQEKYWKKRAQELEARKEAQRKTEATA
jgi:hypothetical protein